MPRATNPWPGQWLFRTEQDKAHQAAAD